MEAVKCAVCGNIVNPEKTPYKTVYEGETYYFCCDHCMSKFNENPELYVKGEHSHHHHGHHH